MLCEFLSVQFGFNEVKQEISLFFVCLHSELRYFNVTWTQEVENHGAWLAGLKLHWAIGGSDWLIHTETRI